MPVLSGSSSLSLSSVSSYLALSISGGKSLGGNKSIGLFSLRFNKRSQVSNVRYMSLDKNKFSFSIASTAGIIYIVCSIFVYLWPDVSSSLMQWLTHLANLDERAVTLPAVLGGLVQVVVYSYIAAWIFAFIHNHSLRSSR